MHCPFSWFEFLHSSDQIQPFLWKYSIILHYPFLRNNASRQWVNLHSVAKMQKSPGENRRTDYDVDSRISAAAIYELCIGFNRAVGIRHIYQYSASIQRVQPKWISLFEPTNAQWELGFLRPQIWFVTRVRIKYPRVHFATRSHNSLSSTSRGSTARSLALPHRVPIQLPCRAQFAIFLYTIHTYSQPHWTTNLISLCE